MSFPRERRTVRGKYRDGLQALEPNWDLRACGHVRLRSSNLPGKGSRGGAEPRSSKNYHQEHEGHEEGVVRESAQNRFVCFALFVVSSPLRVSASPRLRASACPFLYRTSSNAR